MSINRKVQETGSSTYIVSLPKSWAEKIGLQKGDELSIIERSDGSLIVSPNLRVEDTREAVVDLTKIEDGDFATRIFLTKYLAGYPTIKFHSERPIRPSVRHALSEIVSMLLGPEIIDESPKKIEIKDLLSAGDLPVEKAIRRAYRVTSWMLDSAWDALEKVNKKMAAEIQKRDRSVNRLYFLVLRQLTMALRDPIQLKNLKIETYDLLNHRSVIKSIERIGDHVWRIADSIISFPDTPLPEKIVGKLIEYGKEVAQLLEEAMNSYFAKDIFLANNTIKQQGELKQKFKELDHEFFDLETVIAINFRIIADSIGRIADYSADISELAFNRTG